MTRESVKEQIFDVSHLGSVKAKLKTLLTGEIVPISEMVHDTEPKEASVEDEGKNKLYIIYKYHFTFLYLHISCQQSNATLATGSKSPTTTALGSVQKGGLA